MSVLSSWMKWVLRIAAGYNVLAGLAMICLYHEGFRLLGVPKPEMKLPIQLTGMFVLLFGVGYAIVLRSPVENRNVLLLGFLSKLLGSLFGLAYVLMGQLPLGFVLLLFVSDIWFLFPFSLILRRLFRAAGQYQRHSSPPLSVAATRAVH